MTPPEKRRDLWKRVLFFALAAAAALPFLIPFAWLVLTAFKPMAQIVALEGDLLPHPPTLDHFVRSMRDFHFPMYLRNTLVITFGSVAGAILGSTPVAYSVAKLEWPDRRLVFTLLLLTMMLPGQVTMIPVFLIFRQLGWVNTFLPLIVPAFLGNAFFVFLLRQFIMGFPDSLIESARLDGASEPRILAQIVMPLCKPALVTIVLFAGIGAWNDFVGPLIYLSSESKKTLALGLQGLTGMYANDWGILMAASLLMALPIILIFAAAQKYFIQGIALSGMKA